MNFKKLVSALVVAGVCGTSALAHAESPLSGNLNFVTDYLWRGQTQTWGKPAIQGGFDYNHASGLFVGAWASNVSGNIFTNGNGMELDIYGGYNGKITNDLSYQVKLVQYLYPGAKINVPTRDKYDSAELVLGLTYKFFNIGYSNMLTDFYGLNSNTAPGALSGRGDSKGSDYIQFNINYEVADKLMLNLHAGKTRVKNYSELNWKDYSIGVSKEVGGFNVGLTYTKTAGISDYAKDNYFTAVAPNGDTKNLMDSRLFLSVGKTF